MPKKVSRHGTYGVQDFLGVNAMVADFVFSIASPGWCLFHRSYVGRHGTKEDTHRGGHDSFVSTSTVFLNGVRVVPVLGSRCALAARATMDDTHAAPRRVSCVPPL